MRDEEEALLGSGPGAASSWAWRESVASLTPLGVLTSDSRGEAGRKGSEDRLSVGLHCGLIPNFLLSPKGDLSGENLPDVPSSSPCDPYGLFFCTARRLGVRSFLDTGSTLDLRVPGLELGG
jgi:hypothetical protein